ncbi:RiPP maturation radical SAM C-methyltransferase [Plantactinospora sp. KBS50]|uniref:RiPP maturation radical SAM C-methyltransferase n=1 Tax=Plantactinospora sp. KBS50 TaxID=2024580 RepID=UPI000BAAA82A|nr:RiPP maturation radical SAM C-methyltransferase [Plantactinospora sp. KBS50]ASW57160.1 B12-binding domain-containing radical SAM protein [Plantactinospora sp. KBS50]
MKVVLVHMPWGSIDVPSLALGILRAAAGRAGHEVRVRYANLDFVDWVTGVTDFSLADYQYFSESSYFLGAGDWVFAELLDDRDRPYDSYARLLTEGGSTDAEIALTEATRRLVPGFIRELAAELVDSGAGVVGFTTTFQQNAASLAVARAIKRLRPEIRIVFGGANCDGPQGAALHRNFRYVDYVVRGEGEVAFPQLLDVLAGAPGATELADISGLCWRDADGTARANPMSSRPLPPADIVAPDYAGYLDRLDASAAADWVAPRLVVEGSRGCWWGEKHHCTFCGLNGSFMQFRSKSPARFLDEVLDLARRHQLLDFIVVDNILDMAYFDSVLRRLAESEYDVRLHFEVKANLRRHHFQQLGESGAVQVQPGVENLSSHVLRLMDKGVTGCQNVRALRDAQSAGVTASWNYLYGFPGETAQDYTDVIAQLPALCHLEPPIGSARIAIERFSPYFDRPELGFDNLRAAPQYTEIYRLPEAELADLAYIFTSVPSGIDRTQAADLDAALASWQERYPVSRLSYTALPDRIVLVSRRAAYDWSVLELATPAEIELFRLLDQPRTAATLAARVPGGAPVVGPLLERWSELGILFHDAGHQVHVAVESNNQVLARMEHRRTAAAVATSGRVEEEQRAAVVS